MYVGVVKLSLVLGESHSLKDKRMVLHRIKDRVRERLGVPVHEVGHADTWQRSELGCAVVNVDRRKAIAVLDQIVRVAMSAGNAEIVAIARDVLNFDSGAGEVRGSPLPPQGSLGRGSAPYHLVDDRTGSGDKAQAQGNADWIPEEWFDEAQK